MGAWEGQVAVVAAAHEAIDEVGRGRSRALVVTAPPGMGMTRTVQELYRVLRNTTDRLDAWPLEIGPDEPFVILDSLRHRVHPTGPLRPVSQMVESPLAWMGVSCRLVDFGLPAAVLSAPRRVPALDDNVTVVEQLLALGPGDDPNGPWGSLWRFALACAGVVPMVGAAVGVGQILTSGKELVADLGEHLHRRRQARAEMPLLALPSCFASISERLAPALSDLGDAGTAVVLVIDNAHWADDATVALVEQTLRNERAAVFILALGWREELAAQARNGEGFGRLLGSARVEHLQMDGPTTDELVTAINEAAPEADAPTVAAVADGNPLAVASLLQANVIAGAAGPDLVREVFVRRWNELAKAEQEVLCADALLGAIHVAIPRPSWFVADYAAIHRDLHDAGVLVAIDSYRSGFGSVHWYDIALSRASAVLGDRMGSLLIESVSEIRTWLDDPEWVPAAVRRTLLHSAVGMLGLLSEIEPDEIQRLTEALDALSDLEADIGNLSEAIGLLDLGVHASFAFRDLGGWIDPETQRGRRMRRIRLLAMGGGAGRALIEQAEDIVAAAEPGADRVGAKWNLARILVEFSELQAATELGQEILPELDVLFPKPMAISSAELVAHWMAQLGQTTEALSLLEALVARANADIGERTPFTLRLRANTALLYQSASQSRVAVLRMTKLLPLFDETFGPSHPETITLRGNLGMTLLTMAAPQQAIPLLQQATEAMARQVPDSDPNLMTLRNNLALALGDIGQVDEAIRLLDETLDRLTNALGLHHAKTIATAKNRALMLARTGKREEAAESLRETLAAAARGLGPHHPEVFHLRLELIHQERELKYRDLAATLSLLEALADEAIQVLDPRHETMLHIVTAVMGLRARLRELDTD